MLTWNARFLFPLAVLGTMALATPLACSSNQTAKPIAKTKPAEVAKKPVTRPAKRIWSFDDVKPGERLPGMRTGEANGQGTPNTWEIIEDPSAPSSPNALAVTKSQNGKPVFSVALVDGVKQADVDLEMIVKADGGKLHQGGGIVWRAKDEHTYYVARWNPLEGNVRVYVVEQEARRRLKSVDVQTDFDSWHELRVVARGTKIECYFDGDRIFDLEDQTLSEPGTVGIWTKADAVSRFDDLTLRPAAVSQGE